MKEERCTKCGATGEQLDWRTDDKGNIYWKCFECEHTWERSLK